METAKHADFILDRLMLDLDIRWQLVVDNLCHGRRTVRAEIRDLETKACWLQAVAEVAFWDVHSSGFQKWDKWEQVADLRQRLFGLKDRLLEIPLGHDAGIEFNRLPVDSQEQWRLTSLLHSEIARIGSWLMLNQPSDGHVHVDRLRIKLRGAFYAGLVLQRDYVKLEEMIENLA